GNQSGESLTAIVAAVWNAELNDPSPSARGRSPQANENTTGTESAGDKAARSVTATTTLSRVLQQLTAKDVPAAENGIATALAAADGDPAHVEAHDTAAAAVAGQSLADVLKAAARAKDLSNDKGAGQSAAVRAAQASATNSPEPTTASANRSL